MLKKILSILYISTIIFSINSMNQDIQRAESCESKLDQKTVLFLKGKLAAFVASNAQDSIINFLKQETFEEQAFVKEYLPYIYKIAFKAQLDEVIKFIKENLITDLNDEIKCIIKTAEWERTATLTYFKTFTKNIYFNIAEYKKYLENLKLDPMLADRIICRQGTHYVITGSDEKYLNTLLRKNFLDKKDKKRILRFLSTCWDKGINAPEYGTRDTALHAALYAHDRYKQNNDKESMRNTEEIIKVLTNKGADLYAMNKQGIAPSHFAYLGGQIGKSQAKNPETAHTPATINAIKDNINEVLSSTKKVDKALGKSVDKKFNNLAKNLALGGISIIGIAALFYCGYKLLNNKIEKANLK